MILFEKFGQHQPLNRQAERYAREGVPLSLSTLADQVGACAAALQPIFERIEAHVMAAERLHGDDTTVPVLAKGKCDVGRSWVYVRDDRPFGGPEPPAAMFHYSRDRSGEHPREHLAGWSGILQADAYGGYGKLYEAGRSRADPRSGVLGARPAQVLRPRRSRGQRPAQDARQDARRRLTHGPRSGQAHRRPVRHRARRSTASPPTNAESSARARARPSSPTSTPG